MSEYAYTAAPINTKALGIGGYKRTIFALHSGGMTIHEIAREFELKPSEVRRVIVDVWALRLLLHGPRKSAMLTYAISRRVVRVAEGARLEIVYTPKAYPGFKSQTLRQTDPRRP